MENPPENPRTIVVISLWTEKHTSGKPAWRGMIRTLDGRRINFSSFTDLNRILCELSGWQDALAGSVKDIQKTDPQDG